MRDSGTVPLVAIDSGQTAMKVDLGRAGSFSLPGYRANAAMLPQLAAVVAEASRRIGGGPFQVAVGTAGLTNPDNNPEELLRLCAPHGAVRVLLTRDSVTSYLGAVGDRWGVVVAAGTGAVTLGVGARGAFWVDGWGNVIGDAGGGHWIGREALDAVMRAHDGRGPATALTEVVRSRFLDLDDAYIELQLDPDWVRVVASFARDVCALAGTDRVAATICERAGEELAHSAATAVERIGEAGSANPLVCLIGGVLTPGCVRDSCIAALRRRWPGFAPRPARGDSLAGVRLLPELASGHPLAPHIAVAGTVLPR